MTQFKEGQEVEVLTLAHQFALKSEQLAWRKAKIVRLVKPSDPPSYMVQFTDGTRAVFDAEHIRALTMDHASEGQWRRGRTISGSEI